jgi:hypothetical protein
MCKESQIGSNLTRAFINNMTARQTRMRPKSHRKRFRIVTRTFPLGRGISTPLVPSIIV